MLKNKSYQPANQLIHLQQQKKALKSLMYFHAPPFAYINHAYLTARSSHQGWQQDLWALRTGTYKLVSLYHLDPYLIVSTRQSDRSEHALLCPTRKPKTLDTKSHHLECPFCQQLIGIPTCSSILLHLGEYCPTIVQPCKNITNAQQMQTGVVFCSFAPDRWTWPPDRASSCKPGLCSHQANSQAINTTHNSHAQL